MPPTPVSEGGSLSAGPAAPARAGSYSRGPSELPLLRETIGDSLRRIVERCPQREALVVHHQGYRATYAELWRQVDAAARGLMARGVCQGDRVGIWAPNRHEWVVTQFATARIGAILVTINPAYKTAELRYALDKAAVGVLVMARGFRDTDYVAMLGDVHDSCPRLREAIVLEDDWETLLAYVTGSPPRRWPSARRRCTATTRSTSSTRRAPRALRRARRSPITTSSTTPTSRAARWAMASATACACRCRSTTRSGW